ncbi:hypothetical protein FOC1_g10009493 [Fusarium oxysporum f. sp. cubense race 1]|uniref:Major facilitator superfamily (MFS) profile domain-containing protein n=1 Tax=Fusarium oxysporum f. sp. cubense (strain race 1) TaxID=1229664 RepID=N4UME8_FUSC1|nr:hypothetical protein FOC1_g10009493 [Fusarium oxysporum f. sp. cubense race 1]
MAEKSDFPDLATIASADHIEDEKKAHTAHDGGHIEGNALLVNRQGEIRKIPVPSSDPNDPLNFKPWEKYGLVFCCCWFSVMGLSVASGLGAILNVFFEMYIPKGFSSDQVVLLITLPTLFIGLAATQNSYYGHLVSRILQGIATGASESLLPLMLTEVTFLHERAFIFGLYWMVQNAISSSLNLASSYINADLGWRWYYWVFTITVGVAKDIGLINVGGVVGAVLGMLYCTFLANPFVLWMARRNRGIHQPEHHLITMAPPAVVGVGMLLLYGFTAGGGATWWGPYLGWTIFQYSFTAVIIISTTFASEAAPKHPGPALVTVVGTKNIISFGVTYGLTPMIEEHGYKWAFGVLAGLFGGIFLLGICICC